MNEVKLVSVTCLNDKYTYKTIKPAALSLQQASAQFLILMFFIHFFLLIQSVLICCCNHTAKVKVSLLLGDEKFCFQIASLLLCFSAVVYAKAGGEEKPGLEDPQERGREACVFCGTNTKT